MSVLSWKRREYLFFGGRYDDGVEERNLRVRLSVEVGCLGWFLELRVLCSRFGFERF